jgi:LCP family protein required for cell wall assembly
MDPDDPAAQRDTSSGVALADVIMLVRIDPGLRRAAVLSIPRDLYLPIYRDGVPIREEKLASSLIVGGIGNGAPTLIETISRNFDVPIHNFVLVDFAGFVQVVDELDGIPMWFDQPIRDVASGLSIPESGCHVLDGSSSLAFVRSRRLEAFVGGRWRRVGVSNDLERNQRQQDFIVLALERLVDRGARSVLVRNDLIEAGADAVILDERLTLRTLLDIGRAFSDFQPSDLERYALPVVDDLVGESMVLRLRDGDEAEAVFDVFRGVLLRPEQVEVVLVDGRATEVVGAEEVPVADQLAGQGFQVEGRQGERASHTVIRVAPDRFDAGVLLAQSLSWTPLVEVVDDLGDSVELVLGDDFGNFVLVPRDRVVVEAEARAQLPGVLLEDEGAASGETGQAATVGRGRWSLSRITVDVDGRPPEGESCP